MNNFSTYASLFACVLSVAAVWYGVTAVKYVMKYNKASVTLAQLTRLEVELLDHADAIKSVHATISKLRSRIGMREKRARDAGNSSGEPDSKTDPQAWKEWKRQQIAEGRSND